MHNTLHPDDGLQKPIIPRSQSVSSALTSSRNQPRSYSIDHRWLAKIRIPETLGGGHLTLTYGHNVTVLMLKEKTIKELQLKRNLEVKGRFALARGASQEMMAFVDEEIVPSPFDSEINRGTSGSFLELTLVEVTDYGPDVVFGLDLHKKNSMGQSRSKNKNQSSPNNSETQTFPYFARVKMSGVVKSKPQKSCDDNLTNLNIGDMVVVNESKMFQKLLFEQWLHVTINSLQVSGWVPADCIKDIDSPNKKTRTLEQETEEKRMENSKQQHSQVKHQHSQVEHQHSQVENEHQQSQKNQEEFKIGDRVAICHNKKREFGTVIDLAPAGYQINLENQNIQGNPRIFPKELVFSYRR